MYSIFVDDSSEHKKAKGVNRNAVAAISHNEYKDVLLNQKRLRHLMNRIQAKIIKQETMKLTKFLYRALIIKYIS